MIIKVRPGRWLRGVRWLQAEDHATSQIARQSAFLVICTLTLSIFLKSFVLQLFTVPSESMEWTLQKEDKIAVTRLLTTFRTPHRGDIIVFRDPGGWLPDTSSNRSLPAQVLEFVGMIPYHSGQHLVKRVVGEAGDVVECRGAGLLYRNGAVVREPFVKPGTEPCRRPFRVIVPARSVWVMGDNRDNSADSRFHLASSWQGCVPLSLVVGRVVLRAWPPKRWKVMGAGRAG